MSPPQEIFTHGLSALPNLISGPNLCAVVVASPELKKSLIGLAKKVGVPRNWYEALPFLEFFTDQLEKSSEPLAESLAELRERVTGNRRPITSRLEQKIVQLRADLGVISQDERLLEE